MPASRRVHELSEAEVSELDHIYRTTNSSDMRTRCQAVLLSCEGYSTPEVAHLVRFSQDTVLYWIDRYDVEGVAGLEDRPRSGRPPKS